MKTASPLGKGAAAKQQDEACAADWKIIFFPRQCVAQGGSQGLESDLEINHLVKEQDLELGDG